MKVRILTGAALGLLLGLPWLAWMALGERLAGLPVVPFDLFELLTRLLPGRMITLVLEGMIQVLQALHLGQTSILGKFAEMVMAYLFSLLVLGSLGAIYSLVPAKLRFSGW
jgi:hypothetical protein